MNAKVSNAEFQSAFQLVLALGAFSLSAWPGPMPAQQQAPAPLALVGRADQLYRADKLLQAEVLYRQALGAVDGLDRRRCFDRLLLIYVRVGRQDQAIRTGMEYAAWMRRAGDLVRARELDLDLGRWFLALGHHGDAEARLRQALEDRRDVPPLPAARQVTALTDLALAVEKQGARERAGRAWQEVETFARARLDGPGQDQDLPLRIECTRRLADSYRFQGRHEQAAGLLEQVLPVFAALKQPDPAGQRDTLRQLAGHLLAAARRPGAAQSRLPEAEKYLEEALELHRQHAAGDRLTRADLLCERADVVERQGRGEEATSLRRQADREYRAVLEDPRAGHSEVAGALAAYWKLQLLYQRTSQYDKALELTQDQAGQWTGSLLEPRLHAEQGRLQVLLGEFVPSRELLDNAVRHLETQSPPNLVELPPALLNLAVAELATDRGRRAQAEKRGQHCLDLYRAHRLPGDLVLVETYNLLGTCAAQDGDYTGAINHFRDGVALCRELGPGADPPRCNLLLNMALLHKAQDDLGRALDVCQEARDVYQGFAAPDPLGLAALNAACAAQLAAQARFPEANDVAGKVLELCARRNVRKGALVSTARHCQALFHLHRRQFTEAEKAWREVEELQGPRSSLRPRTLNYLALTRECQGQFDEAEQLYREALELEGQDPGAFPVTHFTTLWRLASSAGRHNRPAEARALLEQAVGVVEKARLRTYGDAPQRAAFFAQFAPGFDQLVGLCVGNEDVAAAVSVVARSRSRTLLDQLLLARVDLLQGLPEKDREAWREQEKELHRRIAALRASALLLSREALKTEAGRRLRAELDAAQKKYTDVSREIVNASPVYRSLAQQEFTAAELDRLRDRALGPQKLALIYHVGKQQSNLLLLGDRSRRPEAFPLTVPAEVAERVARPAPVSLAQAIARTRGIVLRPDEDQPELPPLRTGTANVPLGEEVLRALVENYLQQVTQPKFKPAQSIRLQSKDPAHPLPAQRPELLADVVLPPAARRRLEELGPKCLIIIPDGALHKLPFEALVLRDGERPSYVLNRLPPLVYAQSVAILALLAERPPAAPAGPRSLLTVAAPVYPTSENRGSRIEDRGSILDPRSSILGLWGQLLPLPHAREESESISRFFARDQVVALRGEQATEKNLVAALRGRHVVHIAAHGIADGRFDNRFGALALTPPPQGRETPENDGFLELHEISTLPLGDCELAVLSACHTNVGPQRPLEAGVTLAGGFLTAGARRVVASHWGVDDRSTARLMTAFFKEVTDATRAGRPVAYAEALRKARRQMCALVDDWSAPYYWAPFVLVGPGD
jgi:CHAT domain-containing protein/tetratricopeptide (TPR) repeat protein